MHSDLDVSGFIMRLHLQDEQAFKRGCKEDPLNLKFGYVNVARELKINRPSLAQVKHFIASQCARSITYNFTFWVTFDMVIEYKRSLFSGIPALIVTAIGTDEYPMTEYMLNHVRRNLNRCAKRFGIIARLRTQGVHIDDPDDYDGVLFQGD